MAVTRQRILDFHARLGPGPAAARRLLDVMDAHHIDRALVSSSGVLAPDLIARQAILGGEYEGDADNAALLASCAASGGRLTPFFFGNPHRTSDVYRDQAPLFRGLELSPTVHGVALTDRRNLDLVAVAEEFGHPVYVVALGRPGVSPADLVELARKFPRVHFVLGHCGFTAIDLYALSLVAPQENIVAETSGCYHFVVRVALDRLGEDRVVFGTEFPLQHPSVEFAKFAALDLPPATWDKVAWRTAHRILDEEEQ